MKKVVYNACHGGFGLSKEALVLAHMHGLPMQGTPLNKSGMKETEFTFEGPSGYRAHQSFSIILKDGQVFDLLNAKNDDSFRSHPILVAVVQKLGTAANGDCAELKIEELSDTELYKIEEYDGYESVERLYSSR